jgi:hypothetical protein
MVSGTTNQVSQVRTASGLNILAGLWLILAPFVLGFSSLGGAMWNSLILGAAIAGLAIIRVINPLSLAGLSWWNFVFGIWLLLSPFIIGFAGVESPTWNTVVVGVFVLAMAGWSALATQGKAGS